MNKSLKVYIQDIFDSIERIENYVLDMNYDVFTDDRKTVDAVIRNLEIIGEATKNISEDFRRPLSLKTCCLMFTCLLSG